MYVAVCICRNPRSPPVIPFYYYYFIVKCSGPFWASRIREKEGWFTAPLNYKQQQRSLTLKESEYWKLKSCNKKLCVVTIHHSCVCLDINMDKYVLWTVFHTRITGLQPACCCCLICSFLAASRTTSCLYSSFRAEVGAVTCDAQETLLLVWGDVTQEQRRRAKQHSNDSDDRSAQTHRENMKRKEMRCQWSLV